MESQRLLRSAQELLDQVEPRLKVRGDTFLDSEGEALFDDLKACAKHLGDLGAHAEYQEVAAAVEEIEHRRSQNVE